MLLILQFCIQSLTMFAVVAAAKELEVELTERENALKVTQDTVVMKEQSLTERDEAIATLQHQSTSVVDQLKVCVWCCT